jgi:hypothetical protein
MESRGRGTYGVEKKEPRKPINRRKLVGVVVVVSILLGVLFFVNYGFPALSFHREARNPNTQHSHVTLWLTDLQDSILDVSFVDDSDLIYRMDIELFNPSFAASAFELTIEASRTQVRFNALVAIRRVMLVLGSATPYDILVGGSNVTGTFVFGNNMKGSDTELHYSATGVVNLTLTEDIEFLGGEMRVIAGTQLGLPDYVYIDVDVIEGLNGQITFNGPFSLHSSTGWEYYSSFFDDVTYRTSSYDPFNNTILQIGTWAEQMVYAWLSD